MHKLPRSLLRSTLVTLAMLAALEAGAEEQAAEPSPPDEEAAVAPLLVAAVRVTPARPAADTLCNLEVSLDNRGAQAVSALAFTVELDGVALPVYANQLFVETVPAGEPTAVELFNFWSSETDRPPPADGTLDVRVTLTEARWLTRDVSEDGTEILTLGAAVPGLPVSASTTLAFER